MATKSKGGKAGKNKPRAKFSTSNPVNAIHEAVPHPFEMPVWAIALVLVIAAIVSAVLLLHGVSFTGKFHAGGSDYVKLTDVVFTPVSSIFIRAGNYSGRINAVRVDTRLTPFPDLKMHFRSDITTAAYIALRKIDATAPPAGSVVYYKDGRWRIYTDRVSYGSRDEARSYEAQLVSLYSAADAQNPIAPVAFNFYPNAASAREVRVLLQDRAATLAPGASFYEYYIAANGSNVSRVNSSNGVYTGRTTGTWRIDLDNSNPIDLQSVSYVPLRGAPQAVDVGYVSSTGSSLRSVTPAGAVTIRYAYDTRIR